MAVKFIFLVLPELHLMDLAGPNQVIHASTGYGAEFEIEYCSIDSLRAPLKSSSGLPIGKLQNFSEVMLNAGDYLIIAGTSSSYLTSEEFTKETKLLNWIRDAHEQGVNICSICTGAFALGACGLLDGIKCTTHFSLTDYLQELFAMANVSENILFTESKGIYTSAGIASGIDLTLHIVEQLKGSYFAHLVARELVVYNRRTGNQKQHSEILDFRNHMHYGIHKVQDWLQENLHKKVNLLQLAEMASMSDRNFTRVFKKETGVTVKGYITILRREKIKTLSKNPDFSKTQIARKCGLLSSRQIFRIMSCSEKEVTV